MNSKLIATGPSKSLFVARLVAGIPLLSIGLQHLLGTAPMKPILEGAGIPFPELNAVVAPIFEILAAMLLLSGFFSRAGALIAMGSMTVATYAHVVFDWPDEPPMALPIIMLLCAGWVALKGGGFWSIDLKRYRRLISAS